MESGIIMRLVFWLVGFYLMWRVPSFTKRGPAGSLHSDANWPRVSVIVPARNEESRIEKLILSLHTQNRPPAEIIVVDDGS